MTADIAAVRKGVWWDSAALWQADYENSRFRLGNTSYATEAEFLTAIGGTTTAIGPYEVPGGDNLVSNGDASNGTTGWTTFNSAILTVDAGEFVLDGNGGSTPMISQLLTMPTDTRKGYKFKATGRKGTTNNSLSIGAFQGASSGGKATSSTITTTSPTNVSCTLGAESSTYFGASLNGSAITGTGIFDNLAAIESVPYAGFVHGELAAMIRLTTPSSASGDQVVAQWGDDTERNRVRVVWGVDTHLRAIVTSQNAERANIDLGAVAVSTDATVEISMGNSQFAVRLNADETIVDQSIIAPGLAKLWTKRGQSGSAFAGTINEVRAYASARAQTDLIVGFGDSYIADTNGVGLISSVNAAGRPAVSYGVGGTTLAQQVDRFGLYPQMRRGIIVSWDGSCNGYAALAADMALYAQIAAASSKFIIVPPLRRANADSGYNAAALALQAAIATAYPANHVDAQAILAANATSPGDDAAVAANVVPDSLLQADDTHLNATGMTAVATAVVAFVVAKGW